MAGRSGPNHVLTKQIRIVELAKRKRGAVLTTLAHHIDLQWMYTAYNRTRKDGAVGVDKVTAKEYAEYLNENLKDLLERFKSGRYKAPPVRRAEIPKGKKTRKLGIPTFEDKILQRAVVMVIEQVYEQDFYDFSYGYRPGKAQHQAIEVLWKFLMDCGDAWVLEMDIKGYFDHINHQHLRSFLDQRVKDGVIRRTIDKWLKAGICEEGRVIHPDEGTPQGGVISPLLSNIFLHEVLDKWFMEEVKPRMNCRAEMVRFADDAILLFENEFDAKRIYSVIRKRFSQFELELHPEKTQLVHLEKPRTKSGKRGKNDGSKRSVNFLGFALHWGKSRRGTWVIKRKTSKKSLWKSLDKIGEWCRKNRHLKIKAQHEKLSRKLEGHYQYFGVTSNMRALQSFFQGVKRIWKKWLNRRSQRRHLSWKKFYARLDRNPLPPPHIPKSIFKT
ncbi:MAG: group II intron reverse transcriptase/maturase [Deltaproteobacteria bacterium]|nr:group II intron reverse transcriptase/maturase [Deltaproteobacteria bacterium]